MLADNKTVWIIYRDAIPFANFIFEFLDTRGTCIASGMTDKLQLSLIEKIYGKQRLHTFFEPMIKYYKDCPAIIVLYQGIANTVQTKTHIRKSVDPQLPHPPGFEAHSAHCSIGNQEFYKNLAYFYQ